MLRSSAWTWREIISNCPSGKQNQGAQNFVHNYKRNDPTGYAKRVATLNLPEKKLKFLPK